MHPIHRILIASFLVASPGALLADPPASDPEPRVRFFGTAPLPDDAYAVGLGRGPSTYLGVRLEEHVDEEGGARITHVVPDSPADAAGLREGDIVIRIDDEVVRGPAALSTRISEREPGDDVVVVVVRDGKRRKVEVELGERADRLFFSEAPIALDVLENLELPNVDAQALSGAIAGVEGRLASVPGVWSLYAGRPRLGIQLVETTSELRLHLGGEEGAGVLVSRVLRGTPADAAGILVGDLIVRVDGDAVADARDLRAALADLAGEAFDVEVIRDGQPRTLEVVLPEEAPPADGPQA